MEARMTQDESGFFREFTLRLCGSLEIQKALWQCLLYARDRMPADELLLTTYDRESGVLQVLATATAAGGVTRSDRVPIAPRLREQLEHPLGFPRTRLAADAAKDPILAALLHWYGWPESSALVSRLIVEGEFVGSLIARVYGTGQYSEEHLRYWSLVNEPAAVALANSRRHLDLLQLKELLADDNHYLREELQRDFSEDIVGAEFGLRAVMEQVVKVAPLPSPVLLTGETGTGKELIANAIHRLSPRRSGPLIKVNCGAIPEPLVDSDLFGHEKGAFTGAVAQKRGRFERAHGGTIFLDEVGELPPHAQVRLLRVLQEGEFERVGGSHPIKVDIRVISATHRNLEELEVAGAFRDDLYYRLGVFPIHIPALRERRADVPALVEHFIHKKAREMGLPFVPRLAAGAMDRLMDYEWPGNVRELSNVVERALILCEGKPLHFWDLSGRGPTPPAVPAPRGEDLRLADVEARHIVRVLRTTGGKVEGKDGAAALLGLHPGTLRHRMRKLAIPFGRGTRTQGKSTGGERSQGMRVGDAKPLATSRMSPAQERLARSGLQMREAPIGAADRASASSPVLGTQATTAPAGITAIDS
jgi:transcriptional regulator with GAF, ATPase, and Fis domain